MPSSPNFRFYTNREYFDELIVSLRGAKPGDRVLLMSMTFDPLDKTIAVLCRELINAASRGVHVTLAVDAHSFLINEVSLPGPLWARQTLPKRLRGVYRHKFQILETINSYPNGHAAIINMPRSRLSLPVSGRSHIKTAVINDRIFIGGCNLMVTNWIDIMISWHDKDMSERLRRLFISMIQNQHAGRGMSWADRSIPVSNNASVLIDSGQRGQSLIFEEALNLIDSAQKWLLITGQYFPNSVTARHLVRATKRGVKVEIIYSHPNHHGLIGGAGQHINILRERTRLPRAMFENGLGRSGPMLHAKLLAADTGVMIGSHNYVTAGVMLGTAEMALKSTDEHLAREAVATLRRALKIPKP